VNTREFLFILLFRKLQRVFNQSSRPHLPCFCRHSGDAPSAHFEPADESIAWGWTDGLVSSFLRCEQCDHGGRKEQNMAERKLEVLKAFFPQSAARSFHVTCEVGDILIIEQEYDHGTMCKKNGVMCFLLEEEVYRYCRELS
ncbi:MAG TPA: hypothetical protein PKN86_03055, partial [Candidatus Obscuribacter sp.]|nr:hypothetical protein [Candidatus Obscuribacter sp.]